LRLAVRILLLALVVLVAAPACQPEGRAPADRPIVLWHSYRGDEERAVERLAKDYERAHPGVSIDVLAVPFEAYASKLEAAIPRAHGPDLFIQAHQWLGPYLDEKLIVPAGDALPDDDVAGFDPVSIEAVTWDHVRYAVPLADKSVALYVNTKLLPQSPLSIEALAAMRTSLPKGVYPLAYRANNYYYHAPFLHAFGGRLLSEDGSFGFVGDDAVQSLVFVRDLLREGAVPLEPSAALAKQLFLEGRAAAVIDGPWLASEIGDPAPIAYRVEPLPPAKTGGAPMQPLLTVEAVFLTPAGAGRAGVRDLARWLGGRDAGIVRALEGHQVVARPDVWQDERLAHASRLTTPGAGPPDVPSRLTTPGAGPPDVPSRLTTPGAGPSDVPSVLRAFAEAARHAVPMPATLSMQAAWEPANQALQKVLNTDADPALALFEAKRRFDDATRLLPPRASPTPLLLLTGIGLMLLAWLAYKRAHLPSFRAELKASFPAYAYVAHAVLVVILLVVFPLAAGAVTSLFAGLRDSPRYVGLANYVLILTARGGPLLARGSFYLTLLVTVVWTVANVTLHLALGVSLGVLLSGTLGRMRAVYRVLLILPWAVPSYVTALAWKGMFHRQLGAVNALLQLVGVPPVSWFSHFSTAFAANVATNVWLGFPFMMVVTLGALTSIPKEVLEAAEVDGATRWQRFRLVTLPLLKPVLLPAVVLGSVWTFNMFNVVFLVSGGEPDGTTDILVSEAYRWAFTRDKQYGYAAAYAVLIFLLLALGSRVLGRRVSTGEEAMV
jgi:arabinogalactan oligomer/maltooligosaccharide transport system permease protein